MNVTEFIIKNKSKIKSIKVKNISSIPLLKINSDTKSLQNHMDKPFKGKIDLDNGSSEKGNIIYRPI